MWSLLVCSILRVYHAWSLFLFLFSSLSLTITPPCIDTWTWLWCWRLETVAVEHENLGQVPKDLLRGERTRTKCFATPLTFSCYRTLYGECRSDRDRKRKRQKIGEREILSIFFSILELLLGENPKKKTYRLDFSKKYLSKLVSEKAANHWLGQHSQSSALESRFMYTS